ISHLRDHVCSRHDDSWSSTWHVRRRYVRQARDLVCGSRDTARILAPVRDCSLRWLLLWILYGDVWGAQQDPTPSSSHNPNCRDDGKRWLWRSFCKERRRDDVSSYEAARISHKLPNQ